MLGGSYIHRDYKWNNQRIGKIFCDMKSRCYNTSDKTYRYYGAKGIKICQEWLNNPKEFEKWSMQNGYTDNLTIDRVNSNKDYCPENCRWITLKDNAKYKSTTHLITVNGITHTGREWSNVLGLGANTINSYIRHYGEDKTKQLINAILINGLRNRRNKQTWFSVYNIN
jgi:hypothetical protein